MHDDAICLKFTPAKLRLQEIFLEPLPPSCCFHEVMLCISVPWETVLLKVRTLKVRLGGEIGYSDLNTHNGYCYKNKFLMQSVVQH